MASVDLFCVPEDRHRVILLVDLLQRAGQSLVLRTEPSVPTSDPMLIICSAAGLRAGWLVDLFDSGRRVVAVRLDDTPLTRPADEVINLQAWPARSADRGVGGLVRLLQDPASVGAARRRTSEGRPSAPRQGRRGAAAVKAGWLGPAVLLGAALLVGLLLWAVAPRENAERQEAAGSVDPANATPALPRQAAVAESQGDQRRDGAAPAPGPQEDRAEPPELPGGPNPTAAGEPEDFAAVGSGQADSLSEPPVDPDATDGLLTEAPVPSRSDPISIHNGSIAHLCRAQTPEAALAWLDVLDWQQRRRLPREPCVARLMERPGFDRLEAQLYPP